MLYNDQVKVESMLHTLNQYFKVKLVLQQTQTADFCPALHNVWVNDWTNGLDTSFGGKGERNHNKGGWFKGFSFWLCVVICLLRQSEHVLNLRLKIIISQSKWIEKKDDLWRQHVWKTARYKIAGPWSCKWKLKRLETLGKQPRESFETSINNKKFLRAWSDRNSVTRMLTSPVWEVLLCEH